LPKGTIFTPRGIANFSQCNVFLKDQFPYITLSQLGMINSLYPVSEQPQFPGIVGYYFRACATAYGDMRYTCPGINITAQYQAYGVTNAWNYLWNVTDPAIAAQGLGVTHTVELNAIFGPSNIQGSPPASYLPGGVNAAIVPVVQGYWSSFIRSYNPNTYRLAGSPVWQTQGTSLGPARLTFRTNATAMALVDQEVMRRCNYFASIASALQQ